MAYYGDPWSGIYKSDVFGRFPELSPGFRPPAGAATTTPTASATTGALPGAPSPTDLAKQATGYTTGVYVGSPFYQNIEALKAGIVPSGVKTQLTQAAAERGVGIGSYGGPQTESNLLRALGLTSLDLQQQAIKDYATVVGAAPGLNLQSLYQTPEQKAQLAQESELARLAREQGLTLEQMREQYGLLQSRESMAAQEAARRSQWEQAILGSRATGEVLDQYLRRYSPQPSAMPSEGSNLFSGYSAGDDSGYSYFDVSKPYAEAMWEAPDWMLGLEGGFGGWEYAPASSPEQSDEENDYFF